MLITCGVKTSRRYFRYSKDLYVYLESVGIIETILRWNFNILLYWVELRFYKILRLLVITGFQRYIGFNGRPTLVLEILGDVKMRHDWQLNQHKPTFVLLLNICNRKKYSCFTARCYKRREKTPMIEQTI